MDSGAQAAHEALWGLFRNHSEWCWTPLAGGLGVARAILVDIRIHTPGLNLSGPPLTAAAAVGRSRLEAVGWELTSGRPWVQNDTKTGHLEHLDNLGPVMVQNDIKTDRLEHLGCPGPKSSKTVPKLSTWSIYLEGLGPIVQNNTQTNNLEPLNNTLRGFAAFQASLNDTLRGVWAFQGPLNDTFRRCWAFWAFLNDTLRWF